MKYSCYRPKLSRILTLLSLLLGTVLGSQAQSTNGFELFMHYPLIGSADDKIENHNALELLNTRFAGDSGVWMNGIYVHDTIPNGSLLRTPPLQSLRKDSIIISAEIFVEAFDGRNHAILVAGDSWRYLGCGYGPQGEFFIFVNGNSFNVSNFELPLKKWQIVSVQYTIGDSSAQLFLNGKPMLERKTTLFAPDDDNLISNSHFGWGVAFGGYMRDLKVWQPKGTTSSVDAEWVQESKDNPRLFSLYPNPSIGNISIESKEQLNKVIVLDLHGRVLLRKEVQSLSPSITLNLDWLPSGTYLIQGTSNQGKTFSRRIIVTY